VPPPPPPPQADSMANSASDAENFLCLLTISPNASRAKD
jgi:hypothetical protein